MKKLILALIIALTFSTPVSAKEEIKKPLASMEAQESCFQIGNEYGISPYLLMAIIEKESGGRQYASNGSCVGLMQLHTGYLPPRMKKLQVTNCYDTFSNILLGTDCLAEKIQIAEDISYALDLYNGNSRAKQIYESGQISKYAGWILDRSWEIEEWYGAHDYTDFLMLKQAETAIDDITHTFQIAFGGDIQCYG